MPVKAYRSVNLPTELYKRVKGLVEERKELGYRSVTEFVAEAVRMRAEEIEMLIVESRKLSRLGRDPAASMTLGESAASS